MSDIIPKEVSDLKDTHLITWLEQGYFHCQRGSREWCQSYMDSARKYILALESAFEDLRVYRTDAQQMFKEAEALRRERDEARAEVARVKSERTYIIGFNDGWEEALEQNFQFPTMLRKMWSGSEVQAWIDDQCRRRPVNEEGKQG